LETEATALNNMVKYLRESATMDSIFNTIFAHTCEKLLYATLSSLKSTVKDETTWHVFIQDLAASLNRAGMLQNTYEQLFREEAYIFMRAKS